MERRALSHDGSFSTVPFNPQQVAATQVGTATFSFTDGENGTFSYTLAGVSQSKAITRQVYATLPACAEGAAHGASPNYQALWWSDPPNGESGWGLNIAHQGNILFITWFTYDTDGKATWFVGSDIEKTGNATYSGTLYKTFGPPMTASPWDPSKVTRMPVGSATLTFRDDDNGTFAHTVSGASGSKAISREVFATPRTRCR